MGWKGGRGGEGEEANFIQDCGASGLGQLSSGAMQVSYLFS